MIHFYELITRKLYNFYCQTFAPKNIKIILIWITNLEANKPTSKNSHWSVFRWVFPIVFSIFRISFYSLRPNGWDYYLSLLLHSYFFVRKFFNVLKLFSIFSWFESLIKTEWLSLSAWIWSDSRRWRHRNGGPWLAESYG